MRTASELRQIARQRLDGKWGTSLVVSLLAALLGCYGTYFTVSYSVDSTGELFDGATLNLATLFRSLFGTDMGILVPLLSISAAIASAVGIARLIVGGAAQLGLCSYYNRLIKGETPQVSELFSRFSFFGKALLLNLYTALLTFLWSLLLVIPGIIATYRYSLAFYVLCDNPEMSVTECVNESKRLMDGHKGRLFCLHLSFIGWRLLSALTLGIGDLWLNPYVSAATSAFYLERIGADGADNGYTAKSDEPEFVVNPNVDGPERL